MHRNASGGQLAACSGVVGLLTAIVSSVVPVAAAETFDVKFGPTTSVQNGPVLQVILDPVATTILPGTNAALSLTVQGDINFAQGERVFVEIDNVAITEFNQPQCQVSSLDVQISDQKLAPLISDGKLTLTFRSESTEVNNFCPAQSPFNTANLSLGVLGSLSYQSNNAEVDVARKTTSIISNLMTSRADQVISGGSNLSGRLTGGGGTPITGGSPFGFIAHGEENNYNMSFSTSLRDVMNAGAVSRKPKAVIDDAGGLGVNTQESDPAVNGTLPAFDIWLRGTRSHVQDETTDSDLSLLFVGADYRFNDGLLIGVLAQLDWVDQSDDFNNSSVDSRGWTVGPYAVFRLHQNLLLDGRVAWGKSSNDVNPLGTFTDSFDTNRWLVRGRLTGNFQKDAWRFSPHAGIVHFEETQDSYTDTLGNPIPSQTITLSRMTFGPNVSYHMSLADGTVIVPQLNVDGIWDFDQADSIDAVTGLASGSDEIRARTEARLTATLSSGIIISGEGFYDGIGSDDLEAYGGSLTIRAPIH